MSNIIAHLFYSPRCNYSKQLISDLWKYNQPLYHSINKIDVSKIQRSQLPPYIKTVPTIVPLDIGRPLGGLNQIRHWINIQNNRTIVDNTPDSRNQVRNPSSHQSQSSNNGSRESINIDRNTNAMKWITGGDNSGGNIKTSMPVISSASCSEYTMIGQEVDSNGVSGNQDPRSGLTGIATSGSSNGFASLDDPTIYQFSNESEKRKSIANSNGQREENTKLTEDMISRKQRERDSVVPPRQMRVF